MPRAAPVTIAVRWGMFTRFSLWLVAWLGRRRSRGGWLAQRGLRGREAEHQRAGDAPGVRPHVEAAGVRARREQSRDRLPAVVEHPCPGVDADAVEGEGDRRDGLDDVVRRLVEGEPVQPTVRNRGLARPDRLVE